MKIATVTFPRSAFTGRGCVWGLPMVRSATVRMVVSDATHPGRATVSPVGHPAHSLNIPRAWVSL